MCKHALLILVGLPAAVIGLVIGFLTALVFGALLYVNLCRAARDFIRERRTARLTS